MASALGSMLSWTGDAADAMDSVGEMTSLLPGRSREPEEPGPLAYCKLTWKQRLIGFAVTFTIGTVFSVLSSAFVPLMMVRPSRFALPYTLGNICSICSTTFLLGPESQARKMFQPERRTATIVYFASMVATAVVAVTTGRVLPVLLLTALQTLAMLWYSLSYIPGARELVRNTIYWFVFD